MGGGNGVVAAGLGFRAGLSPRGRGKQPAGRFLYAGERSIPAWAGETVGIVSLYKAHRVYPRVGGGNRLFLGCQRRGLGLSPRGRGKQLFG